ncbi:hypothetical protein ACN28C_11495 [Plantactinospora sp. WMMC1484]|uniref:hypothetical protein n=1 Tax=Plantactinospora sp. WMMC1484 TaxID=3404122 RepID=UPI003BF5A394
MSKKFLGKVIAAAAFGGASLLVFTPSAALADGGYPPEGQRSGHAGRIFTKPHVVKAGDKIEVVEVCPEAQQHAWLWSRVTGKVDLTPEHRDGHPAGGGSGESGDGREGGGETAATERPSNSGDYGEYKGEDDKQETPSPPGPSAGAVPAPSPSASGRPGADHRAAGPDGWTGGGRTGFEYGTTVTVPRDAEPGSYELKGSCGEGELVVAPKGWVDGGAGGTPSGSGDNLAVAGTGMLGLAALGGLALLRRRRTDESPN